jgi:hypothetical protein
MTMTWGERVFMGTLIAGAVFLLVVVVGALMGFIPSGSDPCLTGNGKTHHYLTGWQDDGGRSVWCGPGKRP